MFRSLAAIPLLGAMLFASACEKSQDAASVPAAPASSTSAPAAAAPPPPAPLKLDEPQAALEFLAQSGTKLEEGQGHCSVLAKYGTVGNAVEKARAEAKESSVRCEPKAGTKAWTCKADFKLSAGDEAVSLGLQYDVDETTRAVQSASLVCNLAEH